eukprot:jgi/Picre1/32414/NNA_007760.t1
MLSESTGGSGSTYANKGKALVGQGDRKLLSLGWFSNKYEDAAELFERGANQFKLGKMWKEAGETYMKLADVSMKLESKHDAASALVEAAKAFQKCEGEKEKRKTITWDKVDQYKDIDFNFDGSREAKLVEECVAALTEGDSDAFSAAVAEFDSLTRLDAFKTELLLRTKRKMTEAPASDDEEDLT